MRNEETAQTIQIRKTLADKLRIINESMNDNWKPNQVSCTFDTFSLSTIMTMACNLPDATKDVVIHDSPFERHRIKWLNEENDTWGHFFTLTFFSFFFSFLFFRLNCHYVYCVLWRRHLRLPDPYCITFPLHRSDNVLRWWASGSAGSSQIELTAVLR